jgi:hypothetical protein
MIRPLDMQVALHALPEQARHISTEQAGAIYRNVQELGQARQENLERQTRVAQTQASLNSVFRPVERYTPERREGQERDGSSAEEESLPENRNFLFLNPVMKKAVSLERRGMHMDLVA